MFNVYRIATEITMKNGASAVLAVLGRDILGLEGGIARLNKALLGINSTSLLVGGALAGAAGFGLIAGLKKVADYGDKLLDQQDKLQRSGISLNEVLRLQAVYYSNISKSIPTSTGAEYLHTVNELRAVTGDTARAAALAPKALMVDALLSNTFSKESHGEYYKLLRSAEMKGISTDPEKLEAYTDAAFSYITAFGGKLKTDDFQTLARRGGTAWMNAKPEALGPLAILAADIGGSGAGTTAMTLQQLQMGANTLSKQQGEVLAKAGLLDMSKVTKTGFGGGRLQVQPGGILGSLQYTGDLPGWIKDVVYPHILAAAGGDEALAQSLIAKISPNRNAAKLINMFGSPGFLDQQLKDMGLAGKIKPIGEAYSDYTSRNPMGVKKAFGEQYESMMQAIGAPLMQAALPVMKAVTEMFEKIGAFANANPETIKQIGEGLAILGGALIGAGVVAILAALGPAGWLAAGMIAMGAAFVIFKPQWMGWVKFIEDGMNNLGASLKAFGTTLMAMGTTIWDFVKTLGGLIHKNSFGGGGFDGASIQKAAWTGGGGVGRGFTGDAGGMRPEFKSKLASLLADANASGHPLSVFSGYRSQAHQDRLFANSDHSGHWVARHSHHTMGIAADLRGDLGWAHAHAAEHGLRFPMPWEKWHIEPVAPHVQPYHAPKASGEETHVHNLHIDGQVIARIVTKHMTKMAAFPNAIGGQDTHSSWPSPGTTQPAWG